MTIYSKSILYITLTFVIIFHASSGMSQPDSLKVQKNAVSINILQLVSGELLVGYERLLFSRISVRGYGGIKYPFSGGPYQQNGSSIITLDKSFLYTKGYRLGADIIYYMSISYGFYISAGFYYFYQFYDHLIYEYCTGQSKENYVNDQSIKQDQYGISTLIGKKMPLSGRNPRWQLDIYGGLGFVNMIEKTTVYRKKQGTCDSNSINNWIIYNPPQESYSDHWQPSMRFGLAISYSF